MTISVVYDHQIFSSQVFGGISRYFYEISNRISVSDFGVVEIVSPLYINEYFSKSSSILPYGVKVRKIPYAGRFIKGVNEKISHSVLKSRKDVDVFHETYYSLQDNSPLFSKRIVTVYDMIHEKYPNNFSQEDDIAKIKAHAVRRADHIICISENTKKDLMDILNVPERKISVVYLGCSLNTKVILNDAKVFAVTQPYLLYVGARGGYKNFDNFLRAYSKSVFLKNEFSVMCFGGGDFNHQELTHIDSLKIDRNKIKQMTGSDEILAALYRSASAFIYPSIYEGFGIPPLEAMTLDCPVVCSNSSSLPEVVGDAVEFFVPESVDDMSVAIERVLSSKERSQALVKAGRKRIKLFSWDKCALDTFNVYKDALSR